MALPFLTGQLFSNTKDTTVTKEKPMKSRLFFPFVYLVPFVVRLFPGNYGRTFSCYWEMYNLSGWFTPVFWSIRNGSSTL